MRVGLSVWCCRVWVICIYECVECVPVAVLSVVLGAILLSVMLPMAGIVSSIL